MKIATILHVHYIFKFSFPKVRWVESWVQRDWGGADDDHNGDYNRCHLQSTDCMPSNDKYNIYTLLTCMNSVHAPPSTRCRPPQAYGLQVGNPFHTGRLALQEHSCAVEGKVHPSRSLMTVTGEM